MENQCGQDFLVWIPWQFGVKKPLFRKFIVRTISHSKCLFLVMTQDWIKLPITGESSNQHWGLLRIVNIETEWGYGFTSAPRSFFTSSSGMSSSRWMANKTHAVWLPRNKGISSFDTSYVDRLVHNLGPNGDAYPVSSLRHGQSMSGRFRMRRLAAMWMQKHATRAWFAKYEISQVLSPSGKVAVTRGLRDSWQADTIISFGKWTGYKGCNRMI